MSEINKIQLSDGAEYDIADAAARERLETVENQLGNIPDITVLSKLQDTVEQNIDNISSLRSDVDTLVGDDADKSVRTIASEELAKELVPENAKDALDTIAEIAAWIQSHPDDAATMNAAIKSLETNQNTMSEDLTSIVSKLTTLIGNNAGKSAYDIAVLALTEALIPEDAQDALNTIQEIAAWIQSHPADAAAMNEKITALETRANAAVSGISVSGTTVTITKGDGSTETVETQDTTYSEATDTAAGLMSAADKTKLDGLSDSGGSGGDPNALAMLWGKEYSGNRTSTITRGSDGNPTSISETGDGNTATRTYSYDADGRIIKETVSGTDPDGTYTKTKELTYGDSGATKVVETYQHTASDPTWADIAAKFKAGLGDIAYKVGDLFSEDWDHYTSGTSHTKYTAPWRYEGSENVTLEDGSKQTGGWIEFAYLTPSYMQFDRPEAFYAAADGLAAGTYYVTHGSTNLQFTLTQDVEVGGRIAFHSTTSSASTSSVDSYKSDGKTLVETVSTTSGTDGTSLGTCQDYLADSNLNGWYLALYGSGRWKDSHVRQWLNSAAAAGAWWTPSHRFDIVPRSADIAMAGFLHGLPQELIDVMIPTKTITYPASVYGNDPDITYDKVILPSWGQMYTQEQYNAENEPLAYYKQLNGTSSRWGRTSSYAARKKYRLDSKSSPTYYWIRSAYRRNAYYAWYVYGGGNGNFNSAYYDNALAPLACIG